VIDFIKISTEDFDYDYLIHESSFKFKTPSNRSNGKLVSNNFGTIISVAEYKGLKFIIKENINRVIRLSINGSLHKFYNDGEHNYDDFSINMLYASINHLCDILKIKATNCNIRTIEFGVNIIPPISSKYILDGLISHRNTTFTTIAEKRSNYYQVKHNNYILKLYDKALQYSNSYPIYNEIFRAELKYTRMFDLIKMLWNKSLINNNKLMLSDLKRISVLEAIGEHLSKIWQSVLFYDFTIDELQLSVIEKRKLDVWQNKFRWEKYTNYKRAYEKKELRKVTTTYSQCIQLKISKLITEKVSQLLEIAGPEY